MRFNLDPLIHERTRLGIMITLYMRRRMGFMELLEEMGISQGNLSSHLYKLEEAGYIRILKTFRKRKPYTEIEITEQGERELKRYLSLLKGILKEIEKEER